MFGKVARTMAYVKAPVKTFAALHPIKFLKWGALFWVGKKLFWDRKDRDGSVGDGSDAGADRPEPA